MNNLYKEPKPIIVKCFKNDGSLHRSWYNSYLIDNNDEYFILCSIKAFVIEKNKRKWLAKEPAITIFPKKKWYNVCAMLKDPYIGYYVNLASPPILEDGIIKYVDYDLDMKLNFENEIKLIDLNEYIDHKESMHYDPRIDEILKKTIVDIRSLMEQRTFPFDDLKNIDYYYDFLESQVNK